MRKDHILTTEEKLSKQQRLEENRRLRSSQMNNKFDDTKNEIIPESPSIFTEFQPVRKKKTFFRIHCQKMVCYLFFY